MRRYAVALALVSLLLPVAGQAAGAKEACEALLDKQTLIWRVDDLAAVRTAIRAGDERFTRAYESLLLEATAALQRGPYSVVHKTQDPPSGDRNDYMSMAPYWWPPESGARNAPYVRRDGEVNPERGGEEFDKMRLRALIDDVSTVVLAAYFSGDERYADHAALLLRVWFINDATRMNPNLNFAQSIPGRTDGRPYGIIDTADLVTVVDAIELLNIDGDLEAAQLDQIRAWFAEFVRWLTTDPMALEERQGRNNHGTHYDAQLMSYALFARNCALAVRVIRDTKIRIDAQIAADGFMPEDISRTRSLHYHVYNLHAFLKVARLAEHLGENLYAYEAEDGASILSTLSLLAGYAGREDTWPHQQIGESPAQYLWEVLRFAGTALESPGLRKATMRSRARDAANIVVLLTGSLELAQGA